MYVRCMSCSEISVVYASDSGKEAEQDRKLISKLAVNLDLDDWEINPLFVDEYAGRGAEDV